MLLVVLLSGLVGRFCLGSRLGALYISVAERIVKQDGEEGKHLGVTYEHSDGRSKIAASLVKVGRCCF